MIVNVIEGKSESVAAERHQRNTEAMWLLTFLLHFNQVLPTTAQEIYSYYKIQSIQGRQKYIKI